MEDEVAFVIINCTSPCTETEGKK